MGIYLKTHESAWGYLTQYLFLPLALGSVYCIVYLMVNPEAATSYVVAQAVLGVYVMQLAYTIWIGHYVSELVAKAAKKDK